MSRLQHTRRRRWARASRRLVVVRRLLCRTAADRIASECEVARADVDVRRVCLVECWEKEFQVQFFPTPDGGMDRPKMVQKSFG